MSEQNVQSLKAYLGQLKRLFKAGQLKTRLSNRGTLTYDPEILGTVQGIETDFDHNPETCTQNMQKSHFSEREEAAIDENIAKPLNKDGIKPSTVEDGQVISPVFVKDKKDGALE